MMNDLYICPDHECYVNNDPPCSHGIVHKKDHCCDRECGDGPGVACIVFFPVLEMVKTPLKILISKATPKATRQYIRNNNE